MVGVFWFLFHVFCYLMVCFGARWFVSFGVPWCTLMLAGFFSAGWCVFVLAVLLWYWWVGEGFATTRITTVLSPPFGVTA